MEDLLPLLVKVRSSLKTHWTYLFARVHDLVYLFISHSFYLTKLLLGCEENGLDGVEASICKFLDVLGLYSFVLETLDRDRADIVEVVFVLVTARVL